MEKVQVRPGEVVWVVIPGRDGPRLGLVTATAADTVWVRLERAPHLIPLHGRWAPLPVGYDRRRIFDV